MSPILRRATFVVVVLLLGGALSSCARSDEGGGAGFGRNSAEARITHLISEGQFAEAEALIAESASSGLVNFTRFQIQKMYDSKDFSIASKKEFQTAVKLLKEAADDNSRLLQKL